jgi:hypothetical protein
MRPREHILKAERLEASLRKLNSADDFEMVIELCVLAATHLFNAALHVEGVTHGHSDQSHTVRPPMEYHRKSPSDAISKGMDALSYLEKLRPVYVRGGAPFEQEVADACLQNFADAKQIFFDVIGDAASDREWSEVRRDT